MTHPSFLNISNVTIDGQSPKWSLGSRFEPYGAPLSIKLNEPLPMDKEIQIDVGI